MQPANADIVTVHRLRLDPATAGIEASVYPWQGTFFKGIPIQISAIARAGCRFAGWEGHQDLALETTLTSDAVFQARFERDPMAARPEIMAIHRTEGALRLGFRGAPALSHHLQWSDDLLTWNDGETFDTDASGNAQVAIPEPPQPARYLRVALPLPRQ